MALLDVKELTKNFGGLVAVDRVDFEVNEGEILGLIGPNGAGKTTLFNCIAGTYRPENGRIDFHGKNLVGKTPHSVCQAGIARTFQIMRTFKEMTVVENVMIGSFLRHPSTGNARRAALNIIEQMGLRDKTFSSGRSLTTADKKRVELARALATEPRLLMLDEVMAGLNSTEIADAVEIVKKLRDQGVTIVMVEHVMEALMPIADRVIVLNYGKKIAEGTPQDIAENDEVIAAYLGDSYRAAHH